MDQKAITDFLTILGATEEPFGMSYSDEKPDGISPKPATLPTRDDEKQGRVNWMELNDARSCVIGMIWRARKKKTAAYFDKSHFGCLGGAFYLGFMPKMLDATAYYVSTGIPGVMEGEHYLSSPEVTHAFWETIAPKPAPATYCVFKPISQFQNTVPELITFFDRPETIAGLCQLTCFVTNDFESVKTPFGAGCSSIVTWPLKYLAEGKQKAVLGGWDPSERKYLRHDELTFTVSSSLFETMLSKWNQSFLTTKTWQSMRKRAGKSAELWEKT